jgi:tetratricopeptide (TPR) repeat protein
LPGKRADSKAAAQRAAAQKEAEAQKEQGNELFKTGAYEDAVKSYSRAIAVDPSCAVYYSNRAQAYLKVQGLSGSRFMILGWGLSVDRFGLPECSCCCLRPPGFHS